MSRPDKRAREAFLLVRSTLVSAYLSTQPNNLAQLRANCALVRHNNAARWVARTFPDPHNKSAQPARRKRV